MKDIWNIKYDWTLVSNTWFRNERLDSYWSGVTYIPDDYFKYKKCLSGITYQFVNQFDDIYYKNPMVGKNWCIYNMYNEFDIINNFMVNMDTVDVCSTSNLDLSKRYYTIDNAYLKTKHKVLLVSQSDNTENGLYNVDQRGYLISSKLLVDSGNTFRYKAYVKLGDNKHKEFHLKNSGDYFPTLGLSTEFITGKTHIIKNFFSYNIEAINPTPKLIFTDYDIARHINPSNYSLYTGFTFPIVNNGDKTIIKYHENEYMITITGDTTKFIYNELTTISSVQNFEGTFPPSGWSTTGDTSDSIWTQYDNGINHTSGGTYVANYDCFNISPVGVNGYLQTSSYIVKQSTFSFWCDYYLAESIPHYTHVAQLYVDISTDGGTTWISGVTNHIESMELSPTAILDHQKWKQFFVDLTNYIGESVIFRFKAVSDYGSYDIAIDDVQFTTKNIFNKYNNWWNQPTDESVRTFVKVSSNFYNNCNVNDYIKFEISGNTNLSYNTFISSKDNTIDDYISLKDPIPDNIISDLIDCTYTITNLQWSTVNEFSTTLNSSYLSKYFNVDTYTMTDTFIDENLITGVLSSGGSYELSQGLDYWLAYFPEISFAVPYVHRTGDGVPLPGLVYPYEIQYDSYPSVTGQIKIYISPKYYKYNHYFDYDGLSFIVSGSSYDTSGFTTNNTYIKYKLYEHLNTLNPIVFNSSYVISNFPNVNLTSFTTGFTVLITDTESSEFYDRYPKGTYLKITPTNPNDIYFLRKNTFVNLNSTYKTLVVDYIPNEYFVIETYKSNSGLTITSIDSIYNLSDISELLYDVYKNEENSWYRQRDDDMRKNISNAYARIIENDSNITRSTTALLTQDDEHKFILEMYNPESLYNNGGHITYNYDPNLIYKPIELIEIGVDKHTKIPVPILNENLLISYDLITGTTATPFDAFTFDIQAIDGTVFNYVIYNDVATPLNLDWGDGNVEIINFIGYYVTGHTYLQGSYHLSIQGDLRHIKILGANGNIVQSDIKNVKNLESLNLSNNPNLTDLNIDGLIYLKGLYLNDDYIINSDKYFNILNSNGLTNGSIDISAGNNSPVTGVSSSARSNLVLKGWTLIYN